VPGEPLAPHTGYSFGAAAPQTTCWRQGLKGPSNKRAPPHLPFPLRNCGRSAVSPATHPVGGPGGPPSPLSPQQRGQTGPHTTLATTRIVRDTRRPPHRTSGIPYGAGEGPGATPPPVPSLQHCDWRLRDSDPGVRLRLWAPFSSSSAFFSLPPFFCLPGELRALALLGAPLLPLSSRTPPLPWLWGYGRAPLPAAPSSGGGAMELSLHRPAGGSSRRTRRGPGTPPPHPGGHDAAVPRRLSSAFPIPLLAPPGSCPGDWDTVTANPGGPASHEVARLGVLGREEK
jgi:hypothetical protein